MRDFECLEVGRTYRDGNGELHKITSKNKHGVYCYRTDNPDNIGYATDGRYMPSFDCPENLIELVETEELRKLKQMIDMLKPDSSFYEKKQEILATLDKYVELR